MGPQLPAGVPLDRAVRRGARDGLRWRGRGRGLLLGLVHGHGHARLPRRGWRYLGGSGDEARRLDFEDAGGGGRDRGVDGARLRPPRRPPHDADGHRSGRGHPRHLLVQRYGRRSRAQGGGRRGQRRRSGQGQGAADGRQVRARWQAAEGLQAMVAHTVAVVAVVVRACGEERGALAVARPRRGSGAALWCVGMTTQHGTRRQIRVCSPPRSVVGRCVYTASPECP
mmetsp:Transcript_19049/g.39778  ORF Transcript_19049/g.39778 Transcript_19049/m.39778 type:complete len:226 (-) Transcript_19049:12-689(-)